MKDFLKILAVVVVSLIAGAYLHKCQSPKQGEPERPPGCVVDTITYVDTIPYLAPQPKQEVQLGNIVKFLPVYINRRDSTPPDIPLYAETGIPPGEKQGVDSVAVEIPITQREYESEDYHAWVSGYEPMLDSIFVFPKREVVTIREPPDKKHWHIGPTIGYGHTPQGFQPFAGLSITYSIISF